MNQKVSTTTNIGAPDLSTKNNTAKYFNNFFSIDYSVGAANDAIVAYFEKYTGNAETGKVLAATVIYTAKAQGIDPMVALNEFQKLSQNQIDSYLAAFLNYSRIPTSLIGFKTTPNTGVFVSRTILP